MSQQFRGLRRVKAQKNESLADNSIICKRKFIEVVSAELTARTFITPAKSILAPTFTRRVSTPIPADQQNICLNKPTIRLKQMAMGHRTTRSVSGQLSQPCHPYSAESYLTTQNNSSIFAPRSTNITSGRSENKIFGHCRGATEGRQKPTLVELSDWNQEGSWGGIETPIRKLLFDSSCKENIFQ